MLDTGTVVGRRILFGVALLSCLWSCGCCGPVAGLYPPPADGATREIYMYNNGWHTGFVLNTRELSPRAKEYFGRFAAYPWVEVGWGDDTFYRAPEGTSGLALQAVCFSRGSVVHVVGVEPDPMQFYRAYVVQLYRLRISEEGYRRLEAYVLDSFKPDESGNPVELQEGLYHFSRFYRGQGHYWLFHTCNNWTAEGLRKTGFPISPAYSQTAGNFGSQVRGQGRKYQPDLVVREE